MNKQEFLNLVQNPNLISSLDFEKLEELVMAFPYCQSAHLLIAKYCHDQSSMLAKQKLNKAAVYLLERKNLRTLLLFNQKPAAGNFNYLKSSKPLAPIIQQQIFGSEVVLPQEIIPGEAIITTPDNAAVTSHKKEADDKSVPEGSIVYVNKKLDKPVEKVLNSDELKVEQIPEQKIVKEEVGEVSSSINLNESLAKRSAFFEELERNLQNLKKLKEENKARFFLEKEEKKESGTGNETINHSFEKNINTGVVKEQDDNFVNKESGFRDGNEVVEEPLAVNNIDLSLTTREEDVIQTASTGNESKHYDLLLEYLDYLSSKKRNKPIDKEKINHLIDKFITEDPTIPYFDSNKKEALNTVIDLADKGSTVVPKIASETFAKLLVKQGKHEKAIATYEELILKNPEKKAYFTTIIEELKKKI